MKEMMYSPSPVADGQNLGMRTLQSAFIASCTVHHGTFFHTIYGLRTQKEEDKHPMDQRSCMHSSDRTRSFGVASDATLSLGSKPSRRKDRLDGKHINQREKKVGQRWLDTTGNLEIMKQ